MLQISNTSAQTLTPGQSIVFDSRNFLHSGCGECFSLQLPASAKLCGNCGSIYNIEFSGNITASAPATPITLAITISGQTLATTIMNAKPVAAGDLVNVNTGTLFRIACCDADRVSVTNVGTNPLVVAPNANLRIIRRS